MTDDAEMTPTIDPADRARATRPRGVPARLGGATWLLDWARTDRDLDPLRDRIYDRIVIDGSVAQADVQEVAWVLLSANYRLDPAELVGLLGPADLSALSDAALGALFGPEDKPQTYSRWLRGGLVANGLDPDAIDPEDVDAVVAQLVGTGRMTPLAESTDADRLAGQHKDHKASLESFRSLKRAQEAEAEARGRPAPTPAGDADAGA